MDGPPVVRKKALDGLKPTSFLAPARPPEMLKGVWPLGPFQVPQELRSRRPEEQEFLLAVVAELADEVRTHQEWCKRAGVTQETVARWAHTTTGRLSAFENGAHWPEWDLLMRLRVLRRQTTETRVAEAHRPR